ncbi:glycerophosphodiester phosphodiesterase [Arsenicitalea aurantiaca]|uniref:Glycerophosphodiester phosphodiesterase n=1 Tax=Arsenicitalea aurantiaca TaxID=1783274 RepID=A0A433XFV6_9HYPH|nr:glycerophosphodiester phosphodiesterase family protein [Arsenicitalea aurantiaca]RUT32946.1 glycerophosphodiester phosphodiesterase [Arsenicitalea aurantiaca]
MSGKPLFPRPIAHRGLHDRANGVIENSASAFEAAIAAGYDIECDLQLTSDGVPVVFHDDDLARLTGRTGKVSDITAEEMTRLPLLESSAGDCPMTFADFLARIDGRTLLQVELKRQQGPATPKLAREAAEIASTYPGPLVFESFDPAQIMLVRKFGYLGPTGIITYRYEDENADFSAPQRFFLRHMLHLPFSRFDFLSVHHEALTLPMVRIMRRLGKPVTTWTIRSREDALAARPHVDQIVFEGFTPERPN